MRRRAAAWTVGRLLADRFIGRTTPGKHHPIWDVDLGLQPTQFGGMEDRAGFAAPARELAAA
ncbi:hypothetical protein ACIQXM_01830 [Arthrobacter sp. NPDC097144]|uniref:hypothetical protein n=1 Tax=Arthrobacter sp. NPDC097144 TaxID=3363946 RepID=UPI003812BB2E